MFETKDRLLPNNYFVDIRVKYHGIENAIRKGIFISMQEFAEILPFKERGEDHCIIKINSLSYCNENRMQTNRQFNLKN